MRTPLIAFALAAAAPFGIAHSQAAWKATGSIDLGFVSATGNTDVATLNFGDKIVATRADWTLTQTMAQVHAKTDGVESANQLRLGLRAERRLTAKFGGFAAVNFERNAFAGFDRRVDEHLGLQWKPIADSTDALTIDFGAVFTQQDNVDGTSASSPSARTALAYRHNFRANTYFAQNVEYLPNLEESGAYRVNTETAVVAPLSARIAIKVGYVLQYNSRPPATFGTTDRVITTGLQLSF